MFFPLWTFSIFGAVLVMDLHMNLALLIASTSGFTITITLTFSYCSSASSPSQIHISSHSEIHCKQHILLLSPAVIILFTAALLTSRQSLIWEGCCDAGLEKCGTKIKALERAFRKDKDTAGPSLLKSSVCAARGLAGVCDRAETLYGVCGENLARVLR